MSTSGTELRDAQAQSVIVSDDALVAELADGRTITVPLAWFPRLAHGTPAERANLRLIAGGEGIHWPDLDEDIIASRKPTIPYSTRLIPRSNPHGYPVDRELHRKAVEYRLGILVR
jgi:hypothetical protein